jgi:glucuronate isomerase
MARDKFLGPNWLLDTKEAVRLFHDRGVPLRKQVGILDTHTHHNLRQIVENRPFPNIWRAEVLEDRKEYANNDHYIIQLAAKHPGFSQAFSRNPRISDFEKWKALSRVFPDLEGNHIHQWLHLNLRRLFGIHLLLNEKTGERIWNLTLKHFQKKEMLPQAVLKRARARMICTTDDPIDDLDITPKRKRSKAFSSFLPFGRTRTPTSSAIPGGLMWTGCCRRPGRKRACRG